MTAYSSAKLTCIPHSIPIRVGIGAGGTQGVGPARQEEQQKRTEQLLRREDAQGRLDCMAARGLAQYWMKYNRVHRSLIATRAA
mmetsp:Transcript_168760/g.324543  ORF Transcript_168760/g.324543 Transcript_168760/m.324543 type:complete len:84 (-) Transcript_168760:1-252(-)